MTPRFHIPCARLKARILILLAVLHQKFKELGRLDRHHVLTGVQSIAHAILILELIGSVIVLNHDIEDQNLRVIGMIALLVGSLTLTLALALTGIIPC